MLNQPPLFSEVKESLTPYGTRLVSILAVYLRFLIMAWPLSTKF